MHVTPAAVSPAPRDASSSPSRPANRGGGTPQPPSLEPSASRGCEDDDTCFSRSPWSRRSRVWGCHGNDGGDPLRRATASRMPPNCPCPDPVHEESCRKPAPNLPSLTGLRFGSGKGVTSLLQGRTFALQHTRSGPCPASCAHLSSPPRWGELLSITSPIVPAPRGDTEHIPPSALLPTGLGGPGSTEGIHPLLAVPVTRGPPPAQSHEILKK